MMSTIVWYLKQLFPFKYDTVYGECDEDGGNQKCYVTVWRMWFGRCYAIKKWELAGKPLDA